MQASLITWDGAEWRGLPEKADLVLCFGDSALGDQPLAALRGRYPAAVAAACSTAGEIAGGEVGTEGACGLAVSFDRASLRAAMVDVAGPGRSREAGNALADRLAGPDLRHVLVFSDGLAVDGTELARGLREKLPPGVVVTGGLAGDGVRFARTLTGLNGPVAERRIVAVGLCGSSLRPGYGSAGGWQPFGPKRRITKADGNVLHQLDGQPALGLYKRYLGPRAEELPASGLLFPLLLAADAADDGGVVRTILAVDEAAQSLTFAGAMPVGSYVRLMRAGADLLVSGAEEAARKALSTSGGGPPVLALLVSCVGRRLVLGQRTEEEVEAVLSVAGRGTVCAGFYSYGEICPPGEGRAAELHNQTMTITTLAEDPA